MSKKGGARKGAGRPDPFPGIECVTTTIYVPSQWVELLNSIAAEKGISRNRLLVDLTAKTDKRVRELVATLPKPPTPKAQRKGTGEVAD